MPIDLLNYQYPISQRSSVVDQRRRHARTDPRKGRRYWGGTYVRSIPCPIVCTPISSPVQFIRIAQASKEICRKYNVPILINDRIDIALAIGADGIHIGQTDMPVDIAKRLLPPNAIIGMTCNTLEHVQKAVQDRVDYVGLGPVWATQTKHVTSPVVGVRGLVALLDALQGSDVKAVSIGTYRSRPMLVVSLIIS